VDGQNRVTIPRAVRDFLEVKKGNLVEVGIRKIGKGASEP